MASRPTDDTIALAAFLMDGSSKWRASDDISSAISLLGFEKLSSQWLAARLVAMCRESAPRFERRQLPGLPGTQYRVTGWAATGLRNQWGGFVPAFDAPSPKPEHLRAGADHAGGEKR